MVDEVHSTYRSPTQHRLRSGVLQCSDGEIRGAASTGACSFPGKGFRSIGGLLIGYARCIFFEGVRAQMSGFGDPAELWWVG